MTLQEERSELIRQQALPAKYSWERSLKDRQAKRIVEIDKELKSLALSKTI